MSDGQDPGPLRALERAVAQRPPAGPPLEASGPGARGAARVAVAGRRRLVFRFAGSADSLALVDLAEAVSLPGTAGEPA